MNIYMFSAFIIYFLLVSCVAYLGCRITALKISDKENAGFILGNRSLNYWLTAFSAHASDMSNWLFMAFPAAIFTGGLYYSWIAIGLIVFMFFNWHFIAPKIRVLTEQYNCTTLSSYFEKRFDDRSGIIRIVTATMSIVFFTIYISAGLKGIGLLLESSFGFPYNRGVFASIAIVFLYTFLGGFIAVAWTDLFQGSFLLCMIILVPFYTFFKVGGFAGIYSAAVSKGVSLSLFPDFSPPTIFSGLLLALGWGLGYFGMPHILSKFMGIRDVGDMYKSKYVGMVWQLLTLTAAIFVGMVGIAYFNGGLVDSERVFIEMVTSLFHPFFAGFILCAILAAIVSTIDSQVLVLASVLTEDFYKSLIHKKASLKELLWVYRIGILVVSLFSCFIALNRTHTIMDLVWFAWTGLGCSFGPALILSIYSKRVNRYGAITGILIGGFISALWKLYLNKMLFTFEVPGMVVGFFISLISIYFVSIITTDIS